MGPVVKDEDAGSVRAELILASASPRRAELLTRGGYDFRILPSAVSELQPGGMPPETLVEENAKLKAEDISQREPGAVVIGCDTVVSLGGQVFGKPTDRNDALCMHRSLSGRSHRVFTGVAVLHAESNLKRFFAEVTVVEFRKLSEVEINTYLDRIDFLDKAGAYAVQDHGETIIEGIHGSTSNVMGLPMERLARELETLDIGRR